MFEYEEIQWFWDVVGKIDWLECCTYEKPYEVGREFLKKDLKLKKSQREKLWKINRWFYDKLYNRVTGYYLGKTGGKYHWVAPDNFDGGITPSDDSFYDLLNHIIAQGEEIYGKCLEEPELIWKYGKNYQECFAYCFQ